MDLSVLENENLPKDVLTFIEEEIGYSDKLLKVLKHGFEMYLTDKSKSRHNLYLFLEDGSIKYCSYLVVICWSESVAENKKTCCCSPYINRMPVFYLQVFMELIPISSLSL